ncbi:hypothetical protein EB796_006837 [Bugula neritina]|uniref:Uncharacterized protein n=1 Tax=Bugula neritina TaxID=10212 RepID=A0A7J7KAJ4_BUGNE|nr:hypothetical protein EB796_006837 [Bugula neritina]
MGLWLCSTFFLLPKLISTSCFLISTYYPFLSTLLPVPLYLLPPSSLLTTPFLSTYYPFLSTYCPFLLYLLPLL